METTLFMKAILDSVQQKLKFFLFFYLYYSYLSYLLVRSFVETFQSPSECLVSASLNLTEVHYDKVITKDFLTS